MRAMVVGPDNDSKARAVFWGRSVGFRIAELDTPVFDPSASENAHHVLIRVTAFSLNYRDRVWIQDRAERDNLPPASRAIGSEFVGQVLAVGYRVEHFRPGDRVMADMSWPTNGIPGVLGGVPTNAASIEIQRIHSGKLIHVPEEMSDPVAAAFVLGAQTSQALVRRLDIDSGDMVLIMAATSNTSMFVAQALSARGARVHGVTLSTNAHDLKGMGYERVFPAADLQSKDGSLVRYVADIGGFRAVVDPFSNIYLERSLSMLGFFGRYVTCGMVDQGPLMTSRRSTTFTFEQVLNMLIVKNLTIIGSCLGLRNDLQQALESWKAGLYGPIIDSIHTDIRGFVDRSFAPDRLGKVVFLYSSDGQQEP